MSHRLIGVGLPRSGTSFLASVVKSPRVGVHEFDARRHAIVVAAALRGEASSQAKRGYLVHRLRHSASVDADVSHLNAALAQEWHSLEPEARFVMSVRDPLSWVDSYARHIARIDVLAWHWRLWADAAFRPDKWPHSSGDELLRKRGLPSLDGFMAYWAQHVRSVLSAVPSSSLLIIPTEQLSKSLSALSGFLSWPEDSLTASGARFNAARTQTEDPGGICADLPTHHVRQVMKRHLRGIPMGSLGLPAVEGLGVPETG